MELTNGIFVILRCSYFSSVCKVVIQSIPASFVFEIAQPLTSTTSNKYGLKGDSVHNVIHEALVPRKKILQPPSTLNWHY
jgi:hypothetical protein